MKVKVLKPDAEVGKVMPVQGQNTKAKNDGGAENESAQDMEEELEEGIEAQTRKHPVRPTQAMVDAHYAEGHTFFRAWCEHCVKGQSKIPPPP